VAARQHGMIHADQLAAAGLDRNAIDYRVRIGRLHLRHRGVYAVGHVPPSPHARAIGAVLACRPDAFLSYHSGGALWAMGMRWGPIIDVTATTKHRHKGIRVHRSRTLTARDVTVHFGIPVTTPARTILDLAEVLDTHSLTRAVNEARLRHRSTLPELRELLARSPGRATRRLRPFIENTTGPTRSRFEDEFLRFAARFDLPAPERNQIVAGEEVDALWRRERLIVELDGREYHEHRFEEDRERDAVLVAAGLSVLRVTWERLRHHADREARRLRAALAARPVAQ
jgi:very-short-patch-repair endonuclease